MARTRSLCFGPYRLDLTNEQLWRGEQQIPLRPKPFAVLRYLLRQGGQLVPAAELRQAVWPDTVISAGVLKQYIHALRRALDDDPQASSLIETVARRGYRLRAALKEHEAEAGATGAREEQPTQTPVAVAPVAAVLVGRKAALEVLQDQWTQALARRRQLTFVTGEPGIGKTTLVRTFLDRLTSVTPCWVGTGQCLALLRGGEPYFPLLSALGDLCRSSGNERVRELLTQHAPTWMVQLSALLNGAEQEELQRRTAGAPRERMLRELAEVLDVLTAVQPVVLWLEDLHWSDAATVDVLAFVARRTAPARLWIISTYRPSEVSDEAAPLAQALPELYAHQWGQELALPCLTEPDVHDYLSQRFPQHVWPTRLGAVLQQRTGGNPLFLTSLVQELQQHGVLQQDAEGRWTVHGTLEELERWTPTSVGHLLSWQRQRVPAAAQQTLAAASVAGMEFSAATVAAALASETIDIEQQCGRLADQQLFLRRAGVSEWPDGTLAARYGFLHTVYQEFWHERVSISQRQQWHLRMGERKEAAYGQRAGEIAAELALHFEQGRDYRKAVQYLRLAGEQAVRRSAHQEAIRHFTKGLAFLRTWPETHERLYHELPLQMALGLAWMPTRGFGAPEVVGAYGRAREIAARLGETPHLFPTLFGLQLFYMNRAEFPTARALAEQLGRIAQTQQDPLLFLVLHTLLGPTLFALGELEAACTHFTQTLALYQPEQHQTYTVLYGQDPGVIGQCFTAWILWMVGYPSQSLHQLQEALHLAQQCGHAFTLTGALCVAAIIRQCCQEASGVHEFADVALTLTTAHGFPLWEAFASMLRGWALVEQGREEEGLPQLVQGVTAYQRTGARVNESYCLALLAAAYGKVGQADAGLASINQALAMIEDTGERYYAAEIYRLKGALLLQTFPAPRATLSGADADESRWRGPQAPESTVHVWPPERQAEAEACFLTALDIARQQQAKSWELRASMHLARLWQRQGKRHAARDRLSAVYNWFTEGFETKDLQEAKALLEELQ